MEVLPLMYVGPIAVGHWHALISLQRWASEPVKTNQSQHGCVFAISIICKAAENPGIAPSPNMQHSQVPQWHHGVAILAVHSSTSQQCQAGHACRGSHSRRWGLLCTQGKNALQINVVDTFAAVAARAHAKTHGTEASAGPKSSAGNCSALSGSMELAASAMCGRGCRCQVI
jgi:hypothetical protein